MGGKRRKKWDLEKLKSKTICAKFQNEIEEKAELWVDNRKNVEQHWGTLKEAVIKSAINNIGYRKNRIPKRPWVTDQMISKMDERRGWKNVKSDYGKRKYKQLNNELRRETDSARERWWKEECDELEEMGRKGRSDLMYVKGKQITGQSRKDSNNSAINNKSGKLLTEPEEIKSRWKEYIEELYDKNGKPSRLDMELEDEMVVELDDKGPDLLNSEILSAVAGMKKNKAEGLDGIPAEFWKSLGKRATRELVELCQQMYRQGVWPEEFTKIVMIPIPKKVNATECSDYRTISLIPHASKILLKILTQRIEGNAKEYISKTQFGFRKGLGTREAIGVMRMMSERSLENDNKIYVCFVDFEKAFDRVSWVQMMKVLKSIGVDWRDRRMVMNLYMNQEAMVRVNEEYTAPGLIGRGVRQGCLLSPLLFTLYAEAMMGEAMEGIEDGVRVGERA